jgi:2-polyprenyl-6-hydroxyphenyl methylase/3-demethylubiquinone-9 3-methyltransferase
MLDTNVDELEVAKFSELAHRWWDKNSEFKPLHEINPLRLGWLQQHTPISGKRVLDVGCGGGILAESMAESGAHVTGIDLSDKALSVAKLHLYESGAAVDYRKISVETLAEAEPESFDVVTCMEMLEHVPDPASVVRACARLTKPGGSVFLSTLNRQLKSYLLAVIGAEYVLRLLPRGTHDYDKFIKPSELGHYLRDAGLHMDGLTGLSYNPLTQVYKLGTDTDVNYIVSACKLPA